MIITIRGIRLRITYLLPVVLVLLAIWLIRPSATPRYNPSSSPAYIPQAGDSFDFYLEENSRRIRNALQKYYFNRHSNPFGDYTLEQVVAMRVPFEIPVNAPLCMEAGLGKSRGILMLHGLSDSPFLLRELAQSLAQQYPCALIRGLLTPGHGTVPGDLLHSTRLDWQRAADYGISSFATGVDELFIVGYSNGGLLALNYLDRHRDEELIAGLVLLSPALLTSDPRAYLSPYLRYLIKWVSKNADIDAAKYESFPMQAAAEFYLQTREINSPAFRPLNTPLMMVISSDDTTVSAPAAAAFFCSKSSSDRSQLYWYQSVFSKIDPGVSCPGLQVVSVADPSERFVSHSHVSIPISMNNTHYGRDASYSNCLNYSDTPESMLACQTSNDMTVYGENSILDASGNYQGKLVRRSTFNPLYGQMLEAIGCFIDGNCAGQAGILSVEL